MGESGTVSQKFENLILGDISRINSILSPAEGGICAVSRDAALCINSMDGAMSRGDLEVKAALARVAILRSEALHKKNVAVCQMDEYSGWKTELLDAKSALGECQDGYNQLNNELGARIQGLNRKIQEYSAREAQQQKEIEGLQQRIRAAQEKNERLNTWWCWLIPGYNIYVIADACSDADVRNLEGLKSSCKTIAAEKQKIEAELSEINTRLADDNSELGKCAGELNGIQQSIVRVCGLITDCGKEILKWDNLYVMYGQMEADIRAKGVHSAFAMELKYV